MKFGLQFFQTLHNLDVKAFLQCGVFQVITASEVAMYAFPYQICIRRAKHARNGQANPVRDVVIRVLIVVQGDVGRLL
jgi:hypothetical protein